MSTVDEPSNIWHGHHLGEPVGQGRSDPPDEVHLRFEVDGKQRETIVVPEVDVLAEPDLGLLPVVDMSTPHVPHHQWVVLVGGAMAPDLP
jgi:hypothetical protein